MTLIIPKADIACLHPDDLCEREPCGCLFRETIDDDGISTYVRVQQISGLPEPDDECVGNYTADQWYGEYILSGSVEDVLDGIPLFDISGSIQLGYAPTLKQWLLSDIAEGGSFWSEGKSPYGLYNALSFCSLPLYPNYAYFLNQSSVWGVTTEVEVNGEDEVIYQGVVKAGREPLPWNDYFTTSIVGDAPNRVLSYERHRWTYVLIEATIRVDDTLRGNSTGDCCARVENGEIIEEPCTDGEGNEIRQPILDECSVNIWAKLKRISKGTLQEDEDGFPYPEDWNDGDPNCYHLDLPEVDENGNLINW